MGKDKASSSFFEKKEPKKRPLPFGWIWHHPRHIEKIKVFFASFLFTKKKTLSCLRNKKPAPQLGLRGGSNGAKAPP
jgi:hypothetical protein